MVGVKCKKCGVPLDGVMASVSRILFGVKPSDKEKGVCNKCEAKPKKKKK